MHSLTYTLIHKVVTYSHTQIHKHRYTDTLTVTHRHIHTQPLTLIHMHLHITTHSYIYIHTHMYTHIFKRYTHTLTPMYTPVIHTLTHRHLQTHTNTYRSRRQVPTANTDALPTCHAQRLQAPRQSVSQERRCPHQAQPRKASTLASFSDPALVVQIGKGGLEERGDH